MGKSEHIEPHPLVRNEDGAIHDEHWEAANMWPCYFTIDGPKSLKILIDNTPTQLVGSFGAEAVEGQTTKLGLLIILDAIDKAGDEVPILLAEILALVKVSQNIKLLLLGETSGVKHQVLSPDVARYDLYRCSKFKDGRQLVS